LEYSVVTSWARVRSESTATSPAAAPPALDAPNMHPPTCRALGAQPTDPTPPRPHAQKYHRHAGGTHSSARLVSAESELGTLPVSELLLRFLHTQSGLGRSSCTTPHPQQRCTPYGTHALYPWDGVPREYSLVTSRAEGSPLRVPQQALLPHRPRSMPQTCHPRHAARSEQSRPIRPSSAARASAGGKQGGTHRSARLVSAESELGTLPFSAFWLRNLHTRSGLGRSGGTTPHPQQPLCPSYGTRVPYPMGWGAP